MQLNEVDINVKNSGLLEVPAGKEVNQLPQSHFQDLIDRKGYEKIIRGLTNLEVWNKNKNPKLSQWASDMADKLKKANHKDESYSNKFQSAIDEIQGKIVAKAGTKAWKATKDGFKKFTKGSGEALKRAGVTAQNAIVAGAAAPIGAKIASTYSAPKKKEQKYSASDVAAIATALRSKSESYSSKLRLAASLLEEKTKKKSSDLGNAAKTVAGSTAAGAGIGGGLGAAGLGGLTHKLATTAGLTQRRGVGKWVRRGLTGLAGTAGGAYGVATGAAKGLIGGAALAGAGYALKKARDAKKAMKVKHESFNSAIEKLDSFLEFARKKSDNQSHYKKLPESPVSKTQKKIIADAERVAGVTPEVDPAIQAKRKAAAQKGLKTKTKNQAAKQKTLQDQYNQPLKKLARETKETVQKVAKNIGSRAAEAKEIFKGSTAKNKALRQAALKGGLKGAALTAGLGAAAYGVHKYRNRDK